MEDPNLFPAPPAGMMATVFIPFRFLWLSLLAASSASSTYVKYASSPPPCRLNIIFDLEMVLHKHADGEFPTAHSIVIQTLSVEYIAVFYSQRANWRIPAKT